MFAPSVPSRKRTIIEAIANDKPAILQVNDLCFRIPERTLFSNFTARIPAGVTLVCGAEGSGKSALLRLLAGASLADAGDLTLNAANLREQPAAYRRQVFWMDPRSDAFDQVTVDDYFKSLPRRHPQFDEHVLAGAITGLSLAPHLAKQLYMLSTGSKRKVWLAAAFASGATATFLDEPFAALDKASIGFVLKRLEQAASDSSRAWIIANYEAPGEVPLAAIIDLGD